jgi:hypothetical protein
MEKPFEARDPVGRLEEIVTEISALYAEADNLIDRYVAELYAPTSAPSRDTPTNSEHRTRGLCPSACGRGRLQRQISRAFLVHGNEVSATTIYEWCRSWRQTLNGDPLGWEHRWSIVRMLRTVAYRVGRSSTRGRPWIWRLKDNPSETDQ